MANETATHDERLRDLEAEAFRTGRTLAEHGEPLTTIRDQQRTAFGNIDSLANAVGVPGDQTISQRLETISQRLEAISERQDAESRRLDTMERVLFALARAQGIDLDATA